MAVSSSCSCSSWSDLPPELLESIFHRLNQPKDFVCSTSFCSSWRQSASDVYHREYIPFLLIFHGRTHEDGENASLFDVSTREESESFDLPKARGTWVCCLTEGFLVIIDLSFPYKVHLRNPFSEALISLPPLISFEYFQSVQSQESFSVSEILKDYIKKAVASTNPSDPNCVVLIIHTVDRKLAFCRCGDKRWTDLESENGNSSFDDIVFFKGVFYAIDRKGEILYCDLRPNPKTVQFGSPTPFLYEPGGKYFAESILGALWVVLKKLDYEDGGDVTTSFEVYEFDLDFKKWKKVRSLKGKALFLCSNGGSVAVYAGSSVLGGSIEGNSVYFMDDSCGNFIKCGGLSSLSIFKWESKQIEKLYRPSSWSSQLFWIKPADV